MAFSITNQCVYFQLLTNGILQSMKFTDISAVSNSEKQKTKQVIKYPLHSAEENLVSFCTHTVINGTAWHFQGIIFALEMMWCSTTVTVTIYQ